MRSFTPILVACGLCASGCAATNMLGRSVHIEEYPLDFGGRALSYLESVPEVPQAGSLPIVVFVEGDGSFCETFSEKRSRRFLTRHTGDYVLVRPRTTVNTVCETDAFTRERFLPRVDELAALVDDLHRRHPSRPVVLLGQSAGAHLAILLAARPSAGIAAVANLSGGVDALREVIEEITRARSADPAQQQQNLREFEELASGLEAGHHPTEAMWGRTRAFWQEMFFSGSGAAWRRWQGSCWIAHGKDDHESVPYSLVLRSSQETSWKTSSCEFRFHEGESHNLLNTRVMREFNDWLSLMVAARPVGSH